VPSLYLLFWSTLSAQCFSLVCQEVNAEMGGGCQRLAKAGPWERNGEEWAGAAGGAKQLWEKPPHCCTLVLNGALGPGEVGGFHLSSWWTEIH
jgi:hypothetical protein